MVINKNPVYDNDFVTLGYLKKYVESPDSELSKIYSKNFGTRPNPPYHINDTWIDSSGKVYVCIKDRVIGKFNIDDWSIIIDKQPYDKLVAEYGEITIDMLASQVYDHKIESFVQTTDPSINWITYIDREQHVYDFWKNPATNTEYVYIRKDTNPITYEWEPRAGSSIVWNGVTGHKNIFNQKPDSYNKSDLWLVGELTSIEDIPEGVEINEWVVASQDSDVYNKDHWSEAIIDIDLTIVETKVYSRTEVDNRLTILENTFNVKLVTTENSILGTVSNNYATQETVTTLDSNLGLVENRVTTTENNVNFLEITSDRTINTISSTNKTVLGTATYGITTDTKFLEGVDYYILVDGTHYEMLAPGTDYNIGDNISDYDGVVYNATFAGGLQGTVTEQGEKVNELSITVGELSSKISEVADITTSNETIFGSVDLENVNESEPINIKIHPVGESISNLLIHSDMLINSALKLKQRLLLFTNRKTGKTFPWYLPTNLWYYDEENYDELVLTYDPKIVTVTRKCSINSYGIVSLLDKPKTETYTYPDLSLTEGDYTVSLVGYNNAYLFVRLLASNIYTTQFYTKAETNSLIKETSKYIYLGVDQKLTGYTTTEQAQALIKISAKDVLTQVSNSYTTKDEFGEKTNELSTRIKSTATSIDLVATDNQTSARLTIKLKNEDGTELSSQQANITLSGLVKFTDLSTSKSTTINGDNVTTGSIQSNGYVANTTGLKINLDDGTIDSKNFKVLSNGNVEISGKITATSGTIGGCTIVDNVLQIPNANITSLSVDKISGGTNSNDITFNGKIICTNAEVEGKIKATRGYIGSSSNGWNIDSSYIYRGGIGGNNGARLYADGRLYMKNNYGWFNSGTGGNFINGNGAEYPVWLSDNLSTSGTGHRFATIGIYAKYGHVRIASDDTVNINAPTFIVNGNVGWSGYLDVRDADGSTKLRLNFKSGICTGYTKLT